MGAIGGLRSYTFCTPLYTCELRRLAVLHLLHAGHLPPPKATVGLPPFPRISRDCTPQPRHHKASPPPRRRMRLFIPLSRLLGVTGTAQPPWRRSLDTQRRARAGHQSYTIYTLDTWGTRGGRRSYTVYTLDTQGHTWWLRVLHILHREHHWGRVAPVNLTHLTPWKPGWRQPDAAQSLGRVGLVDC